MRFSLLRPKAASSVDRSPPDAEPGSVQLVRVHARRRLAGALVLLGLGVAVFPVLFETQPRAIAVDTPILMPALDAARVARSPAASAPAPEGMQAADAGTEIPAPIAASAAGDLPPLAAARVAADTPHALPDVPARAASAARQDDGARAQALLDARGAASEAAAGGPRFVVQAGAYSEAAALREARQKVEKLGLKTYTQVIESDNGKRTRVRIGPFTTRQEAQAAADKVKAAGLQASILAL